MRRSSSRPHQLVGLLVAVVALVGTVALDWEFGAPSGSLPFVLGLACALLAVGAFTWRRFG